MLEVKADPLEASFEALERQDEDVTALKAEMAALKARMDEAALAAARPALSGAKAVGSAFVDSYLRKGIETGVELKAVVGTSDAAGTRRNSSARGVKPTSRIPNHASANSGITTPARTRYGM